MRVSTHRKSQIVGITDQLTNLGMKLGGSAIVAAVAYFAVVLYGGHIHGIAKMDPGNRDYLLKSIALATQAVVLAGFVLVASAMVRHGRFEECGQVLTLSGAAFYFGTPALLSATVNVQGLAGNRALIDIVSSLRSVGVIALVPGLVLVLRDGIVRIWTGISVKRVMARRWQDAEGRRGRRRKGILIPKCWEMDCCRDFVRNVCPAFHARKNCWRIKTGCCDETVILKAMAAGGQEKDNIHAQGIMASLGLDKPADSRLSRKIRTARCKRCFIYSRHQADKYRVLSPLVFPAVLLVLYTFYGRLAGWMWFGLEKIDRFMSFLTYKPTGSAYSFADDGRLLTGLAIAWLTLMAISYALRALEYFVFELQV